jgi:pimeloyl-ACP methyl ester carboxylesterase
VVFIPGLGGIAQDWWGPLFVNTTEGDNDMYAIAYEHGYRTAFVTFTDRTLSEPGQDQWQDGKMLATQVRAVVSAYNVDRVTLVGHSKGGIDANAAVIGNADFAGVADLVRNVITLSSPHQGAELADFAATDKGKNLLNQVGLPFGADSALMSLTTDNMTQFRQQVDSSPLNQKVRWFTAAGTDWGPEHGVLRVSGSFLDQSTGASDGLVSVSSAMLPSVPCSRPLFIQPYNHFDILLGRHAFPWINAVMQRYGTGVGCSATTVALAPAPLFTGALV